MLACCVFRSRARGPTCSPHALYLMALRLSLHRGRTVAPSGEPPSEDRCALNAGVGGMSGYCPTYGNSVRTYGNSVQIWTDPSEAAAAVKMSRRDRSKAPATTGPNPPSLLSKLSSRTLPHESCGVDDCSDGSEERGVRAENGQILASRRALSIGLRQGTSMRSARSRCASCSCCVTARRRGAAVDDKSFRAILVAR